MTTGLPKIKQRQPPQFGRNDMQISDADAWAKQWLPLRVTVPPGKRGDWEIAQFTIGDGMGDLMAKARAWRDGKPVTEGLFTQLRHKNRGTIMSDTASECAEHYAFAAAPERRGHVLMAGLGLGLGLRMLLLRPEIASVTVLEIDADVIALTAPHYKKDRRVSVLHADARRWRPREGQRFDAVWLDIWDAVSFDNLSDMQALVKRYKKWSATTPQCWTAAPSARYR